MRTYSAIVPIAAMLLIQMPSVSSARGLDIGINLMSPAVVQAPPVQPQYPPMEQQPPLPPSPQAAPAPAYPPPETPPPANAAPPAQQAAPGTQYGAPAVPPTQYAAPQQYAKPAPLPAPEFVYIPRYGFYAAVGYPYDVIYIGRDYYLFYRGYWYQGPFYNGPWVVAEPRLLPRILRRSRWEEIRYYRDYEYGIYARDRAHYRGRFHRPEFRGEFRFR